MHATATTNYYLLCICPASVILNGDLCWINWMLLFNLFKKTFGDIIILFIWFLEYWLLLQLMLQAKDLYNQVLNIIIALKHYPVFKSFAFMDVVIHVYFYSRLGAKYNQINKKGYFMYLIYINFLTILPWIKNFNEFILQRQRDEGRGSKFETRQFFLIF